MQRCGKNRRRKNKSNNNILVKCSNCDSISIGDINHVLLGCETHRNKIDRLYLNIKGKNDFPTRSDILLASLCEGGPIADFFIKHIIWLPIITQWSLESVTTG